MFGRNYFASLGCSCLSVSKEMIYAFRCHPKEHLNYHVKKVCIKVSHKNDLQFQVIPFKKYLYDIKPHPFFVFDEQHEYFEVMIDHQAVRRFLFENDQLK